MRDSDVSFDDLPLLERARVVVHHLGWRGPTPTQQAVIPRLALTADVLGSPRAGSGESPRLAPRRAGPGPGNSKTPASGPWRGTRRLGDRARAIPSLVREGVPVGFDRLTKPLTWRDPVVPSPAGISGIGTATGGRLTGGVYAYRVVAWRPVGGGTRLANSDALSGASANST